MCYKFEIVRCDKIVKHSDRQCHRWVIAIAGLKQRLRGNFGHYNVIFLSNWCSFVALIIYRDEVLGVPIRHRIGFTSQTDLIYDESAISLP